MDPVVAVVAFGTALVGAIATDVWQKVHDAVADLWRRVHPRLEDDGIGAELDELREQVLARGKVALGYLSDSARSGLE